MVLEIESVSIGQKCEGFGILEPRVQGLGGHITLQSGVEL